MCTRLWVLQKSCCLRLTAFIYNNRGVSFYMFTGGPSGDCRQYQRLWATIFVSRNRKMVIQKCRNDLRCIGECKNVTSTHPIFASSFSLLPATNEAVRGLYKRDTHVPEPLPSGTALFDGMPHAMHKHEATLTCVPGSNRSRVEGTSTPGQQTS
jgi:hypothetical protein